MPEAKTRIVVTGASGFIGRHVMERALRDGLEVVALSRRGTGRSDVIDVRVANYEDPASLAKSFGSATAVVHLAARAHQLRDAGEDLKEVYESANVRPAIGVARAARLAGTRRLVLVSSIGVNGSATYGRPFCADDAPNPLEPYALSKLRAELAVAKELQQGKTDFVILRPPLVYGAGCPGNFQRLLRFTSKAPFVPLGALAAPRALVFVENLADAILIASSHHAVSKRTLLIADDQTVTVAEVVRLLAAGAGRSTRSVLNIPPAWLRVMAMLAGKSATLEKLTAALEIDASEFGRLTGWKAPFAPEEGLRITAQAFRAGQVNPIDPKRYSP